MFYGKLLEKIILPLGDLFVGSNYIKSLKKWRKIDTYSSEELERLQRENLKKILLHASHNIPFYKNIELPENETLQNWLQRFPILSKSILNAHKEKLIAPNTKKLLKIKSSGSSGKRTEVYMNQLEISNIRACNTHWWEWAGYRIGSALLQTGITTDRSFFKKTKDFLFNTDYINAFAIDNSDLEVICTKLQQGKSRFILGYASSINIIAEYAKNNNFSIQLEAVISLGDKLFDHYRSNIENAFQCKVYETYGSSEGFKIAAQYDLEYLYINTPQVYLEVLDDANSPVKDGEIGHVVVTRLDNFSMPLIRYRLGDLCAVLPRDEYPKQRKLNYPLLKKVIGRDTDVVVLPNNKKMVVHSFTGIFEHIPSVKQFKIIQKSKQGIIIQYIPTQHFSESTQLLITEKLQGYIQDSNFAIEFEKVKFIQPSPSGKPQIIESLLK